MDAFRKADEVLFQAIKGISDLITQEGIVNVDFADVRAVMAGMGRALMGTGCAKGDGRARLAAQEAITSPLLDDISVDGATGVLINIVGGPDMKMREIQEAATLIQEQAHEDANIIFGATVDESMSDMLKVTVIATGFDRQNEEHAHLMKQASRQPMEREALGDATVTSRSSARIYASHHGTRSRRTPFVRPAPSAPSRRSVTRTPHSRARHPASGRRADTSCRTSAERITFPVVVPASQHGPRSGDILDVSAPAAAERGLAPISRLRKLRKSDCPPSALSGRRQSCWGSVSVVARAAFTRSISSPSFGSEIVTVRGTSRGYTARVLSWRCCDAR